MILTLLFLAFAVFVFLVLAMMAGVLALCGYEIRIAPRGEMVPPDRTREAERG